MRKPLVARPSFDRLRMTRVAAQDDTGAAQDDTGAAQDLREGALGVRVSYNSSALVANRLMRRLARSGEAAASTMRTSRTATIT